MTRKKHKPDPEILALMGEEERKKLLERKMSTKQPSSRKPSQKTSTGVAKNTPATKTINKHNKAKKSGKKKPENISIHTLMSNDGGRSQSRRVKHQTGNPRYF